MMIGQFTKNGDSYTGNIDCFALHVSGLTFKPVPMKQGNGPDFVILAENFEDAEYEIGAAWNRVSSEKKGSKAYLSVRLDGPTLPAPIDGALMRQPDGTYGLIWKRVKAKADNETAAEEEAA